MILLQLFCRGKVACNTFGSRTHHQKRNFFSSDRYRKRVKIAGGDGTDLLAIASRMARAKDSQREALKKTLAPAENELPMLPRPSSDSGLHVELGQRLDNLSW